MRKLVGSLGFAAIAFCASSAAGATISASTVGLVDEYLAKANIGDSELAEETFIANYFGWDLSEVDYTKIDEADGETNAWKQVVGGTCSTCYAFDFQSVNLSGPDYFLIKLGGTTFSHFLYKNLESLRYAVVDLSNSNIQTLHGNIEISRISHAAAADGPTAVPEPASLSLLLLGILGVGAASRKVSLPS